MQKHVAALDPLGPDKYLGQADCFLCEADPETGYKEIYTCNMCQFDPFLNHFETESGSSRTRSF